jgi:hypothetical protein
MDAQIPNHVLLELAGNAFSSFAVLPLLLSNFSAEGLPAFVPVQYFSVLDGEPVDEPVPMPFLSVDAFGAEEDVSSSLP